MSYLSESPDYHQQQRLAAEAEVDRLSAELTRLHTPGGRQVNDATFDPSRWVASLEHDMCDSMVEGQIPMVRVGMAWIRKADLLESLHRGTAIQAQEFERLQAELTTLRAKLAAVEGERERVMADYASELAMIFADRKANRMELLAKAAAVEEQVRLHEATIERQAEAIGILQRAESEAERRGAERALRLACPYVGAMGRENWIATKTAALFPAPATDTQVQPPTGAEGGRDG